MKSLNFMVQPDGTLTPEARKTCANFIAMFAGKWIKITIAERKEKRSLEANSYYWSAIIPHVRAFMLDAGDAQSIDAVHELLLSQFAPTVNSTRLDGTQYTRPMRSKEMSVQEMSLYIEAITACMAGMGSPIMMKGYDL